MELLRDIKIALCSIAILIGCDRRVDLLLNSDLQEKLLDFACGTASFRVSTVGGYMFSIKQIFNVTSEVTVDRDSLQVIYRNVPLTTTLYDDENGKKIESFPFIFSGHKELLLGFDVKQKVVKGDTIAILPSGYLYCSSKRVSIDTINVIINRDF